LLATIAATGTNRKATMQLSLLKQMFGWANGRKPWKLLVDDPVINLKASDVTQAGYKPVERERVLSKDEITKLHRQIPEARLVKTTEALIWITLSCCTRVAETLKAEWQHIDLENLTWFIPESNTKGAAPEHTVHLSEFAANQFRTLKALAGNSKWCFPKDDDTSHIGVKSPTKQIGDRQATLKAKTPLNKRSSAPSSLVVGSEGWTPHDLRRTGMTLMQSLGVPEHVIERIANHIEQNKIKRTYQRYDYDAEKRDAWNRLGQLLVGLLDSYECEKAPIC
jgi:integrase